MALWRLVLMVAQFRGIDHFLLISIVDLFKSLIKACPFACHSFMEYMRSDPNYSACGHRKFERTVYFMFYFKNLMTPKRMCQTVRIIAFQERNRIRLLAKALSFFEDLVRCPTCIN